MTFDGKRSQQGQGWYGEEEQTDTGRSQSPDQTSSDEMTDE